VGQVSLFGCCGWLFYTRNELNNLKTVNNLSFFGGTKFAEVSHPLLEKIGVFAISLDNEENRGAI